ncbi:MAG: trehalose-6-phosphate synthase [Nitrospirota bacterium]
MKITVRLIVSLVLVVAVVTAAFSFYQVDKEKSRMTDELERRTTVLADSLRESVATLVRAGLSVRLNRLVVRFGNRKRLKGIAVFDTDGNIIASTPELKPDIAQPFPQAVSAVQNAAASSKLKEMGGKDIYISVVPVRVGGKVIGSLALFDDASYINVRLKEIWKSNLLRFLVLTLFIVLITVVVVKWSITGPIARIAEWMKEVRTGKDRAVQPAQFQRGDILASLINEASHLAKSLAVARAGADGKARRFQPDSHWTAHRLKEHMIAELNGKKLFMLSNREPYMHVKEGRGVRCVIPAGGVVTALDPVMRICDGIWLAHGGGDADRETVDDYGKVRVPPEDPAYTLRRIWLSKEEEKGYYYGFSNEGIYPLCLITHTRPIFRLEDWICYQKVNKKFADALLEEIAGEESPLILVHDYQLALLPLLVKEKRPDARVALFWHIPWPNPEVFGICPWQQEILLGMLAADIVGFHIQFHCNNFLEAVDRFLESKTDWEQFSVSRSGHTTLVKPFPVSVNMEGSRDREAARKENGPLRENLIKETGVQAKHLGVGVDRIDYAKGIPERFRAVERFLEKYPEFIGEFTFLELGAPSRTHIKKYHDFMAEVEETVESINWRFQTKEWKPIIFLKANHSHDEINRFYKAADLCMVTSLHDGMNLVAKEFVASRDDEDGVLILSQFAGASRELSDALIVNPYDTEEMADAIYRSLTMSPRERSERMARMRAVVWENNIYRWAGDLVTALARLHP